MKTHQITSHDMTWHLATNHIPWPRVISQPPTKFRISPGNQPHQNRSPHHHHGTAEGSFTQKTRFGHRSGWSPCAHSIGKFFLWLIFFFLETSAPGLPGSTCTDYLLGRSATTCRSRDPLEKRSPFCHHGISSWSWIRDEKEAVKTAQKDNRPLHEVLREVTENTELKDLYFTSPVTFSAMQRPQKFAKQDDPDVKIKGKHKGKDKGKGDAFKTSYLPGSKLELLTHTPDGKQICYRFNMKGKKCDGRCERVHICRVKGCGANHPAFDHPTTNWLSVEQCNNEFETHRINRARFLQRWLRGLLDLVLRYHA